MEPVFEAPRFDQLSNYPVECRERFMTLSTPNHRAPMWKIDKCLDDYNLWLSIYSD